MAASIWQVYKFHEKTNNKKREGQVQSWAAGLHCVLCLFTSLSQGVNNLGKNTSCWASSSIMCIGLGSPKYLLFTLFRLADSAEAWLSNSPLIKTWMSHWALTVSNSVCHGDRQTLVVTTRAEDSSPVEEEQSPPAVHLVEVFILIH